jgi:hypothetical protein
MLVFETGGNETNRVRVANELVEGAWRTYRKRMNAAIDTAFDVQNEVIEEIGLERLPAEVVLLSAAAGIPISKNSEVNLKDPASVATYRLNIHTLACWAAWRESKTLYCVEPALAQCLSESPWPELTPIEALRLPSRMPVLVFPGSNESNGHPVVVGVRYDVEQDQDGRNSLEVRFNLLQSTVAPAWIEVAALRLTHGLLGECFDSFLASLDKGVPDSTRSELRNIVRESPFIRLAITTLLYLGGEPDIVKLVHPGTKPAIKESLKKRDPDRWRDLRDASIQMVGRGFQQLIERWEVEQKMDSGLPTGQSVRPHVRRAHSHLYWTGTGRQIPRVKFLLPIPVKGASIPVEKENTSTGRVG